MATNDEIVQGNYYTFRQNVAGLGRNKDLDGRRVRVVAKNCIGSGGVHLVKTDEEKTIYAMDRELHRIE